MSCSATQPGNVDQQNAERFFDVTGVDIKTMSALVGGILSSSVIAWQTGPRPVLCALCSLCYEYPVSIRINHAFVYANHYGEIPAPALY